MPVNHSFLSYLTVLNRKSLLLRLLEEKEKDYTWKKKSRYRQALLTVHINCAV